MLHVRTVYAKSIPPIALGICVSFTPASTPVLHFDSCLASDLSTLSQVLSRICRSEKIGQKPKVFFAFYRLKPAGLLLFYSSRPIRREETVKANKKARLKKGDCAHLMAIHRLEAGGALTFSITEKVSKKARLKKGDCAL
jgi:hypothetical protein